MINLMKQYEILEHPADLKIRAFGKTKEELFFNTLKGMTESLKPEMGEMIAKRTIKISSPDLGALLIDFLSEVLYLIQTNKEIYTNINFKKLTDIDLEGELIGRKTKRFGEDIKAATYHDLDIHQKENGTWEATVLFDI
jgi:SHS2 domain-containing protein